jgi:dTMP kinase
MAGRFYVIEGADGVGTSTQSRALATMLSEAGRRPHVTAEPSSGPIGRLIRELLGGDRPREEVHRELALLFAADRLDHVAREIVPRITEGYDVISDRYLLSSLVYQALDLPLEWVTALNRYAPVPDATVLLTVPLEVALARLQARAGQAEIFDDRAVQARVHQRYAQLGAHVSAITVDADAPVADVTLRIRRALEQAGVW